jgi:adenylylsulfate kinase
MRSEPANPHIRWHEQQVTRDMRVKRNGHCSALIWLTGLPSSGKSTLAHALEDNLFVAGKSTYVLDGDNVRHGLCSDLGFTERDRVENIRRIGEMAKLFLDAGIITFAAFISPYEADRLKVRELVGPENFIEIYCRCPLEVCEARDPKGNYAKARSGIIANFTGISAPYQAPAQPALTVDTDRIGIEESVMAVLTLLHQRGVIEKNPSGHGT